MNRKQILEEALFKAQRNGMRPQEIEKDFWLQIKNQSHGFFTHTSVTGAENLWRCSHQTTTELYGNTENQLIDWNGALRWIYSD